MRGITLACVLAIGCANNVPQDRFTGPDGRPKGAVPIPLAEGEAIVKGIVTYPGGDRVDWKSVELPAGKRGRLDFQMKWQTPRPGLQLAFDVFDQWNNPVAMAKGKGRLRDASVLEATGKYFVRVYAKGRGDAGQYKLAVAFKAEDRPKVPDPLALEIPDPPRLPDIPVHCDLAIDPTCGGTVKPPPPTPPTPPPVVTPPMTPPPPPAKPIMSRVIKVDVSGDSVIVTIGAGSEHGVDKSWTGQLMRAGTTTPLTGGKVQIIRVEKTRTIAKVPLTTDIVTSNPVIELKP